MLPFILSFLHLPVVVLFLPLLLPHLAAANSSHRGRGGSALLEGILQYAVDGVDQSCEYLLLMEPPSLPPGACPLPLCVLRFDFRLERAHKQCTLAVDSD